MKKDYEADYFMDKIAGKLKLIADVHITDNRFTDMYVKWINELFQEEPDQLKKPTPFNAEFYSQDGKHYITVREEYPEEYKDRIKNKVCKRVYRTKFLTGLRIGD